MPTNQPVDLDVGPYRTGEEAATLDCMRACFGVAPDPARWRQLHFHNPAGESVIVLARHAGTVVGEMALMPHRFVAFGQRGLAGRTLDVMTHPQWRSGGVSRRLYRALDDAGRGLGHLAAFSFANADALPAMVKHQGTQAVSSLPVMVRPLRPLRAGLALAGRWAGRGTRAADPSDCAAVGPFRAGATLLATAAGATTDWTAPRFDRHHTELFEEAEGLPPIGVVRDAVHLTWRYAGVPDAGYVQRDVTGHDGLRATILVRSAELFGLRLGIVMEWAWRADARRDGALLLRDAARLAADAGLHGIAAMAMPRTLQRQVLRRHAFVPIPSVLFPKSTILNVRPELGEPAPWLDPGNWYLTWGDGFLL